MVLAGWVGKDLKRDSRGGQRAGCACCDDIGPVWQAHPRRMPQQQRQRLPFFVLGELNDDVHDARRFDRVRCCPCMAKPQAESPF